MSKGKLCIECAFRVEDYKYSPEVLQHPHQWKCKKHYWQDISICLKGNSGNHSWANRCKYFERD